MTFPDKVRKILLGTCLDVEMHIRNYGGTHTDEEHDNEKKGETQ